MNDTEPTGLTVSLLLAKLICEPKAGFIGVEFRIDREGYHGTTLISVHPDGTQVPLWTWDGGKEIVREGV